ncbi:MAG TPA: endo alpha-1,4 polygalactosaminidase [Polyangia bacterium]|nr:endo alpha-1,4 polygalactosaminidase [Polyangia bacterium]
MWDSVVVRSARNRLAARPPGGAAAVAGAILLGLLAAPGHAENDKPAAGPGIRADAPWLSFYGTAEQMGDLDAVATRFRLINIDADPDTGNFSARQIRELKAGGRNTVISYLNIGSCERTRRYWKHAPAGLVPCAANRAAQIAPYRGFPDELWMNPSNPAYQRLILEHVAPRLAATGVDGFFLDNLEIVEHGATGGGTGAPCDRACVAGTLALVARLRQAFPGMVLVMQNATSATTREAVVGGVPFPRILDGVSHEEVYAPRYDRTAEAELLAWAAAAARHRNGARFSITTLDYVGNCRDRQRAERVYSRSRARGFSPYATISSANQDKVCDWRL